MADKVVVRIDGDSSGFKKSLAGIEGIAKKGLGVTLKGITAVGAGFTAASVASLKFAGDLEQNLGGAKAVFGEFADEIEKKADTAFKSMGLSTSHYLATANKMGSLFKGAGFETKEAMDMTSEAMQRAADVASIMGIDVGWAMESIAGAAKGNFTMMDNLGVAMNETTLNAYALEVGLGKTTQQMTMQEKVVLAMEMFLARTSYAAGNYAKENETLAGALTTAKAALQNFMAGTGDVAELENALTNAADVITENIQVLGPKLAEGIGEIIRGLIPVIPDILEELLPSIIETIEVLFETAAEELPDFIDKLAEGIGDAVPVLSPLTSLLSFLAKNIDLVSSAAITGASAFATYKAVLVGFAVVQSVTQWIQNANTAMLTYQGAVTSGASASTLLLGVMSPLQLVYGVITGKIKLAEAAQAKFNLTAASNVYAVLAAALVAVIAAVVQYAKTHKTAGQEIQESLKDIQEEYDQTIKSIEETKNAEIAEAQIVTVLTDQLFGLEEQLKSNTLTEAEAKAVQQQFNATASELESMIPGITSLLYDETGAINVQTEAVYALAKAYVQLAMKKAMVNAYQSRLDAAAVAYADAKQTREVASSRTNEEWLKMMKQNEKAIEKYGDSTTLWGTNGLYSLDYQDASRLESYARANEAKFKDLMEKEASDLVKAEAEVEEIYKNNPLLAGGEGGSSSGGGRVSSGGGGGGGRSAQSSSEELAVKQADRELAVAEDLYQRGLISAREYYDAIGQIQAAYLSSYASAWDDYERKRYEASFEVAEEEYEALKRSLRQNQISTEDYYKEIARIRDTYYSEGGHQLREFNKKVGKDESQALKKRYDKGLISTREYYDALGTIRDTYFEKGSDDWESYNEEQYQAYQQLAEEERAAAEKAYDRGLMTQEDYFADLARIRNQYFEEGSADWKSYTESIEDGWYTTLEKQKNDCLNQLREIENARQGLAERLNGKSYFTRYTIEDKNGVQEYLVPGDFGRSADSSEKYAELLGEIQERYGELPSAARKAFQGMSEEDGIQFAEAILGSPELFDRAMKDWERESAADEKSAAILYEPELEEFKEKIEEVFGQVPADFFALGEDAAEQFGTGLLDSIGEIVAQFGQEIQQELSRTSTNFLAGGQGGYGSVIHNDQSDNSSIVVTVNGGGGKTPAAIAYDVKNYTTYYRMTKPYGGK